MENIENDIDFIKNKNYDDVFLRDMYSALSFFFLDTIKIKNVVDEKIKIIDIPVLPSFIGDENFIKDFFINYKKLCCGGELSTIMNRMPSGRIISSGSFNLDDSVISSNGVRTKKEENTSNEFIDEIRTVYSRNTILGLNTTFNVEFKCNTFIERMKIFQSIINFFYKERTFYFSSCGVHKIPASVSITSQYRLDNKQQFKFADFEGHFLLSVSFDMSTFFVVDDSLNKLTDDNKVFNPDVNIVS